MSVKSSDPTPVLRTPNPHCPACKEFGRHLPEDWTWHAWAGHGINGVQPCQCKDPACPYRTKDNDAR
jgi:hypothetical protein